MNTRSEVIPNRAVVCLTEFLCGLSECVSGKVPSMARKYSSAKPMVEGPVEPEHGTARDVEKLFGISRRICEQKVRDGSFQSVVLSEAGSRKSTRLIYLDSVRRYLRRQQASLR